MPSFRNKHSPEAASAPISSAGKTTFCFAPNVTPTTYPLEQSENWNEDEDLDDSTNPSDNAEPSPFESFFTPALPRPNTDPHTRRMSEDHIPRPPNAFILFRSDLVHRKAVPSSIESDHGSISKIIGHCWRTLPPRQKKIWEKKAAEAKAAHKVMYPNYRYSPVHRKDGAPKRKVKKEVNKDERRCEDVARLLMSGAKGEELESKVRELDAKRPPPPDRLYSNTPDMSIQDQMNMPPPGARMYRRSSSAPLPGATFDGYEPSLNNSPIMLPSLPPPSLPSSPARHQVSLAHRTVTGHVRSSSATPSSRRARAVPNSKRPKDQVYQTAKIEGFHGIPSVLMPGPSRAFHVDQSQTLEYHNTPVLVEPFNGLREYRFPAQQYDNSPLPVGSSFEYFDAQHAAEPSMFRNGVDPTLCLSSSPSSSAGYSPGSPFSAGSPFERTASPFANGRPASPFATSAPILVQPAPSPLSAVSSSLHNWSGGPGSVASQSPSPFQPQHHPHYPVNPSTLGYTMEPAGDLSEQLAHFELNGAGGDAGSCSGSTVSSALSSPHSQSNIDWDPSTPTQKEAGERQQRRAMDEMFNMTNNAFGLEFHDQHFHQHQQQQQYHPEQHQQQQLHPQSFTASLFHGTDATGAESDIAAYGAGLLNIEGFQMHDLIQPHAAY